jgi:Carboxypeptidase regulatory-like domain/TonB-dependent Receptor Plug Domain
MRQHMAMRQYSVTFRLYLILSLSFLVGTSVTLAQVSASITGRVEDPSGAAIGGATVTVTNTETGAARTVTADSEGNYRVLSLPVGGYEIKTSMPGFKTSVRSGISLVVGQQAVLTLTLEVGDVQQEVTVTAGVPVVNISPESISGLVGERQVKDLPLNGRSFDNLITLNPSAINYTAFAVANQTSGGGPANSFQIAGRRNTENLFLLNGIEYMGESGRVFQPGGVSGQLLGIDAVREFNVLTDTYAAEYGKRPGGQISVVTQSGTNVLHGTVFEFLRNSVLDARNYFDAPPSEIGKRIPQFQRNQFGMALGGPIRKDKYFLFANYEGFRQELDESSVSFVPDANARKGLLPNAEGVPTPVPNLNPNMLPFFALWPEPNSTDVGGGIAVSLNHPKQSIREDFGTVRADQILSTKDSLSEAYTIDDGYSLTPQPDPLFSSPYTMRNQVLSVQDLHIISSTMLNNARVGYSRASFDFSTIPTVPFPASFSLFSGQVPGNLSIGGGFNAGAGTTTFTKVSGTGVDLFGTRNIFTATDDFQMVLGKHQVTVGGWFQQVQDNRNTAARKAGAVSFGSITTFLQGTASDLVGTATPTTLYLRMPMGAWYVQDTFKVKSNLTLNLGLRQELAAILSEKYNRISNFVLDSNGYVETSPILGKAFTSNHDLLNFGPRIGLAWDVFGTGRTAVRSGFGIHYNLPDFETWEFSGLAPYNTSVDFGGGPFLSLIPVNTAAPVIYCGPGVPKPCQTIGAGGILSNQSPTLIEWNLAVEQQIDHATSLRVGYVGSHGYHELANADKNSIRPLTCADPTGCISGGLNATKGKVPEGALYIPVEATRPNPYLSSSFISISTNTSYNAMQVDLTRRLAQGLQFRVNYTWSKNLDVAAETDGTSSANQPGNVTRPWDPKFDWGPAGSDVRNVVSMNGTYELPFGDGKHWLNSSSTTVSKLTSGWQVNTIVNLLSGFPFLVLAGSEISGNGNTSAPDAVSLNPNFHGTIIEKKQTQWYNPNAFILPISGTFGDVRKSSFTGPGLDTWDLSLLKDTQVTERLKVQFRAEGFNILNHANFGFPTQSVFSGTTISPTAGVITATTTTSRQLQFGLKFIF